MIRPLVSLLDRAIAWRSGRHYHARLRQYQEMDGWSRERLLDWRRERVTALLTHAYDTVPYYREVIDAAGLAREELVGEEALARLPLLTKGIINARREAMMSSAPPPGRTTLKSTGGSTGTNVWFEVDLETHDCRRAAGRLTEWWDGVVPGTRTAVLWGASLETKPSRASRLYDRFANRLFLSVYGVGDDELGAYREALRRFRPEVISSYPSILLHMAQRMGRAACRELGVRVIFTSAEALFPAVRAELEELFGAPVRNRYAAREFGMIAGDDPDGDGLLVSDMRVLIELLPPETPGGPQEMVITDLDGRVMPLIRYRIGDLALPGGEPPAGGRPWTRLASVEGRSLDVVVTPEGRAFGGTFFTLIFRPQDASIRQFQVVQDALDHLAIKVEPGEGYDSARRDALLATLREQLGPSMRFDLEEVERIERLGSGKRRFVVSELDKTDKAGKTAERR